MPDDDEKLVQCCLRGNAAAYGALYDRHAGRINSLLVPLNGNR